MLKRIRTYVRSSNFHADKEKEKIVLYIKTINFTAGQLAELGKLVVNITESKKSQTCYAYYKTTYLRGGGRGESGAVRRCNKGLGVLALKKFQDCRDRISL